MIGQDAAVGEGLVAVAVEEKVEQGIRVAVADNDDNRREHRPAAATEARAAAGVCAMQATVDMWSRA